MEVSEVIKHGIEQAKLALQLEDFKKKEQHEIEERKRREERIDFLKARLAEHLPTDFLALLKGHYECGHCAKHIFDVNGHRYWFEVRPYGFDINTKPLNWQDRPDSQGITENGEAAAEKIYRFIAVKEPDHEEADKEHARMESDSRRQEERENAPAKPREKLVPADHWYVSQWLCQADLQQVLQDIHEAHYLVIELSHHDGYWVVIAERNEAWRETHQVGATL